MRRCHWCGEPAGWHHTRLGIDACGTCATRHWPTVTLAAIPEPLPAEDDGA